MHVGPIYNILNKNEHAQIYRSYESEMALRNVTVAVAEKHSYILNSLFHRVISLVPPEYHLIKDNADRMSFVFSVPAIPKEKPSMFVVEIMVWGLQVQIIDKLVDFLRKLGIFISFSGETHSVNTVYLSLDLGNGPTNRARPENFATLEATFRRCIKHPEFLQRILAEPAVEHLDTHKVQAGYPKSDEALTPRRCSIM